jgi:hypothetical protein
MQERSLYPTSPSFAAPQGANIGGLSKHLQPSDYLSQKTLSAPKQIVD